MERYRTLDKYGVLHSITDRVNYTDEAGRYHYRAVIKVTWISEEEYNELLSKYKAYVLVPFKKDLIK